ncbi:UNVERIFIED_CONTAM: hypothetical protein Sradi_6020900 [Sesamum radiatum]|uniref:Uncharacterized protein n=1 Tax=Sesamum radiatum TaxID=300843 RepID=A0AAW2KIQ9_SESRA
MIVSGSREKNLVGPPLYVLGRAVMRDIVSTLDPYTFRASAITLRTEMSQRQYNLVEEIRVIHVSAKYLGG